MSRAIIDALFGTDMLISQLKTLICLHQAKFLFSSRM